MLTLHGLRPDDPAGHSEIIKRVGWLAHKYEMDTHYERPLQ
jgi:hypothetical protein